MTVDLRKQIYRFTISILFINRTSQINLIYYLVDPTRVEISFMLVNDLMRA